MASPARAKLEPAIECAPIKLSVDETKTILRISVGGKPIESDYHHPCAALADIGILRRIEVAEEKDTQKKINECWKKARIAFGLKDGDVLHQAMHDLEQLTRDRHRETPKYLYDLTDLGKQIARGITVRLNGQYRK